jgi:hypothetical protein
MKNKENMVTGIIELRNDKGSSWVVMDRNYSLFIIEDRLKGEFTIDTVNPVFKRREMVTIKPAGNQDTMLSALNKDMRCEIQDYEKSKKGYTYEI